MSRSESSSTVRVSGLARNLPSLLFGVSLALALLGFGFLALSWSAPVPDTFAFRGHAGLLTLAFGSVGWFMTGRRPRNSIGWLFLVVGLGLAIQEFGQEYVAWAFYEQAGRPPAIPILAWVASWVASISLAAIVLTVLLFPTGRLPSPRWRPFVVVLLFFWAGTVFSSMIKPGPLRFAPFLDNSFSDSRPIWDTINLVAGAGITGCLALMGPALLVRLSRARGIERQQLKWFAYTAALVVGVGLIYTTAYRTLAISQPSLTKPIDVLAVAIPAAIPFSVAFAILRYHLYDIDLLIRRTLIYGLLIALLVSVYFMGVVLFEQLFFRVTGQRQSDLVIVLSTLAIAALFSPLRTRVQAAIDLRFYRRKYDAAKVLAAFGSTARDEVDLGRLSDNLLVAVDETMQPASVSLWLRGSQTRSR